MGPPMGKGGWWMGMGGSRDIRGVTLNSPQGWLEGRGITRAGGAPGDTQTSFTSPHNHQGHARMPP